MRASFRKHAKPVETETSEGKRDALFLHRSVRERQEPRNQIAQMGLRRVEIFEMKAAVMGVFSRN